MRRKQLERRKDMFKKEYSAIYNKENRNYMFAGLFLVWIVLALMA